ncbi:MAG: TetR/AcrR family transcriptional regulator [Acidimicrobiales bacterium]
MGRRPNPQRKQDLLEEIVEYLGEHGIGDLSLRPLAKKLGTSTYTLTYQFGSKDGLLIDAVSHAEARQVATVRAWVAETPDISATQLLRRYWAWFVEDENLRLVRMLIEAATLARSQPDVFGEIGNRVVSDWIELLSDRLTPHLGDAAEARRLATQVYATVVGLQFDLIATADAERVERAFDELCRAVDERTGVDGAELAGAPAK